MKNTEKETNGRKLTFDRMEDKTNLKDVFTSIKESFKSVFGKQKDNKMFNDLNVKKGIVPGIRYALYIAFVLPFKIIAWLFTPRWEWVYFVRRHIVSPIFEVEAISGDDSPSNILGELYEKYLNFLDSSSKTGASEMSVKPEISRLERLMIFAKLRVLITLGIFAVVALEIYELIEAVTDDFALLSSIFGGLLSMGNVASAGFDGGDILSGFITMREIYIVLTILFSAMFSYIFIFGLRFVVESFKSVMYADSEMMKEFVDDTLHYTVSKAIELHGEDRAMDAYELLLENVVINTSERYVKDDYYYKRLERKTTIEDDEWEEIKELT